MAAKLRVPAYLQYSIDFVAERSEFVALERCEAVAGYQRPSSVTALGGPLVQETAGPAPATA